MRKSFLVVLLSFMTVASSAGGADAGGVMVRGSLSCGRWVEVRTATRPPNTSYAEAWVIGFVSGFSLAKGQDVLSDTDSASVFLWMDNYCRANPLNDVTTGAFQLFGELAQRPKRLR